MKVKIKGLVFVGFAAAVFAQSAMATISANTADKKIVTSKYYVDSNFQDKSDRVTALPTGTEQEIANAWNSTTTYPSMAILKSVKDKADAINVVEAEGGYVDVSKSGDTYTLNVDAGKIDSTGAAIQASGTTDDGKLVTAGAVKAILDTDLTDSTNTATTVPTAAAVVTYAEAVTNKAPAIVTDSAANDYNAASNDKYPTTAAVYNFVTSQGSANYQRKLGSGETGLYVGAYDANNANTWKAIQGASTTGTGAATDDVTINETDTNSGVYEINLDSAQIASSIAASSGSSTKLATEGAVYNFVTTGYQPINDTTTVKVSYNGEWSALTDGGSDYIDVARNSTSGNTEVTLTNLTAATTDFDSTNNRTKLARSGDVYDFVMAQTGGLAIPEMPDGCDTVAATGGYCALVYGLISGTAGQSGATYGLQWTVMAPDTMPTGTGD